MVDRKAGSLDVSYVARLARLALTDEEKRDFQAQLDEILRYVEKIQSLDLAKIEPMSHPLPATNVLRADEVRPGLDHATVLANAPQTYEDQFFVPRIIE